jgi:hypothetical protein
MDNSEADAIEKMLKWTISTLKQLDSELLAFKMALANYPRIVKAALPENVKFDVEQQDRLLQVSVQVARNAPRLLEVMQQKYDTWLERIQRPASFDALERALKELETWRTQGLVS